MIGKRFHKLTVIEEIHGNGKGVQWKCLCDCGITKIFPRRAILKGTTKSCSCHKIGLLKGNKYGFIHGGTGTGAFKSWTSMHCRCLKPNDPGYHRYGGRGIQICERWLNNFENFFADMGERPKGTTLDRKDNDGDYSPDNCRWADKFTQDNNKSTNIPIIYKGKKQTMAQWARELGLPINALKGRKKMGWPIKDIFERPIKNNGLTGHQRYK